MEERATEKEATQQRGDAGDGGALSARNYSNTTNAEMVCDLNLHFIRYHPGPKCHQGGKECQALFQERNELVEGHHPDSLPVLESLRPLPRVRAGESYV